MPERRWRKTGESFQKPFPLANTELKTGGPRHAQATGLAGHLSQEHNLPSWADKEGQVLIVWITDKE